jgi:hypothetical protein
MTASARGTVEEPGRNVKAKVGLNYRPGALQRLPGVREDECGGIEFRSARP